MMHTKTYTTNNQQPDSSDKTKKLEKKKLS